MDVCSIITDPFQGHVGEKKGCRAQTSLQNRLNWLVHGGAGILQEVNSQCPNKNTMGSASLLFKFTMGSALGRHEMWHSSLLDVRRPPDLPLHGEPEEQPNHGDPVQRRGIFFLIEEES